jgi:hypothetical protein
MLNLLNLLAASSAVSAFALPKIEIRQESSPLKITHVLNVGPTCSSSEHTNVLVAKTSLPGLGATAVIDFFKGEAYAKPEGGNTSYSDCTITVDFSFPIGFHLNSVNAIANGVVDFDDGMTQAVKMDIWFPSKNDITVSISFHP